MEVLKGLGEQPNNEESFFDSPEGKEFLTLMDEFTSLLKEAEGVDNEVKELLKKKEPIQARMLEIKKRWKVLTEENKK